jgi:hypothetical protein
MYSSSSCFLPGHEVNNFKALAHDTAFRRGLAAVEGRLPVQFG